MTESPEFVRARAELIGLQSEIARLQSDRNRWERVAREAGTRNHELRTELAALQVASDAEGERLAELVSEAEHQNDRNERALTDRNERALTDLRERIEALPTFRDLGEESSQVVFLSDLKAALEVKVTDSD